MIVSWVDFQSSATQLAVLVAATGLIYRLFRLVWPDVPEAIVQVVALILSTSMTLTVTVAHGLPFHQWLLAGIASGVLLSGSVIKLLDWSASAMTKTGAPALGISEKPPDWYIDLHPELFPKASVKRTAAETKVGVDRDDKPPTFAERREVAAEMQKPTPRPAVYQSVDDYLKTEPAKPPITPTPPDAGPR